MLERTAFKRRLAWAMRAAGMTSAEIGAYFGVSPQRGQQLAASGKWAQLRAIDEAEGVNDELPEAIKVKLTALWQSPPG